MSLRYVERLFTIPFIFLGSFHTYMECQNIESLTPVINLTFPQNWIFIAVGLLMFLSRSCLFCSVERKRLVNFETCLILKFLSVEYPPNVQIGKAFKPSTILCFLSCQSIRKLITEDLQFSPQNFSLLNI